MPNIHQNELWGNVLIFPRTGVGGEENTPPLPAVARFIDDTTNRPLGRVSDIVRCSLGPKQRRKECEGSFKVAAHLV